MASEPLRYVDTLTFDIFGTVLDLSGSLIPPIDEFLVSHPAAVSTKELWSQWRARQRIEQYQDNLLLLGHSGYLETCRRALVYTLKANKVDFEDLEVANFMSVYKDLRPYKDAIEGLVRLREKFDLVALSNGEKSYLEHLVANNIKVDFDAIISVEEAGFFKPHPSVYRTSLQLLGKEPGQVMMVAAHSFDIVGARACGYRGVYVNRYGLPTEESPYQPDFEVGDFVELANRLGV